MTENTGITDEDLTDIAEFLDSIADEDLREALNASTSAREISKGHGAPKTFQLKAQPVTTDNRLVLLLVSTVGKTGKSARKATRATVQASSSKRFPPGVATSIVVVDLDFCRSNRGGNQPLAAYRMTLKAAMLQAAVNGKRTNLMADQNKRWIDATGAILDADPLLKASGQ